MLDAAGILTARGGMTSHAAVVARGMGKCCVSGAGELQIDYKTRTIRVNGYEIKEGDGFRSTVRRAKFISARWLRRPPI